MLNVFTLASSINESVSMSDLMLGEAYDFAGNVDDASYDFAYLAMQEAVEAAHFDSSVNEIMVEAAIGNPTGMEALTEASIKEIWGKIKAFFKRVWEWVKGLIAKIVNYIKATIAKTKGYQKSVLKRAEKLMKDGKSKSVKINAYEYNYDAIASLEDRIGNIYNSNTKMIDAETEEVINISDIMDKAMQSSSTVATDSTKVDDIVKEYKDKTDAIKNDKKNDKNSVAAEVNAAISAGAASDAKIGEVFNAFATKCRGEKKEIVKTAADVKGLVDNFDKYTKLLNDGTKNLKAYEKQLKDINTRLARVKGTGEYNQNLRNTQDQADTKAVGKAKIQIAASAYLNAVYSYFTSATAQLNAMLSGANSTLRTLCNGMIANDMTIINKILGGKDAKAKKEKDAPAAEEAPAEA